MPISWAFGDNFKDIFNWVDLLFSALDPNTSIFIFSDEYLILSWVQ